MQVNHMNEAVLKRFLEIMLEKVEGEIHLKVGPKGSDLGYHSPEDVADFLKENA